MYLILLKVDPSVVIGRITLFSNEGAVTWGAYMGTCHTVSGSRNLNAGPPDPGIVVKGSGVSGQNLSQLFGLLSV